MIDKVNYKSRTHDLKKIFHGAGQFYWGKVDSWLKKNFLYSSESFGFDLPRRRAIDVDNMEDLNLLKKIFYSSLDKK